MLSSLECALEDISSPQWICIVPVLASREAVSRPKYLQGSDVGLLRRHLRRGRPDPCPPRDVRFAIASAETIAPMLFWSAPVVRCCFGAPLGHHGAARRPRRHPLSGRLPQLQRSSKGINVCSQNKRYSFAWRNSNGRVVYAQFYTFHRPGSTHL